MAEAPSLAISVATAPDPNAAPFPGMVWVPGGTFHMGSVKHYPEAAPVHRVSVDGFWMDRTPMSNSAYERFLKETGYVTFAEIPPGAEDYPGALPEMLYPVRWCSSSRRAIEWIAVPAPGGNFFGGPT